MSDYLNNLVARQLGLAEVVRPRLTGRFEPPLDARAPGAWGPAAAESAPEPEPQESTFEVGWRAEARGDAESEPVPREEPARVTSPTRRSSSPVEPIGDSPRAESFHTHPATHRAPSEFPPPQSYIIVPPNVSPPARDETPAARAELPPTGDNVVGHQSRLAAESESFTPPRRQLVVPELAAAEPSAKRDPVTRDAPGEKSEPSSTDTLTPAVKLSAASHPRDDRHVPAPPEQRAALQVVEGEPPRRDKATPRENSHRSENTPPHVERPATTEAPERAAVEVATSRGDEQAAGLTIEPRISRHVPPRRNEYDAARPPADAAPTINVTIGRVEVRATQAPPAAPRRRGEAASRVSLDEYLRRRAGGGAG